MAKKQILVLNPAFKRKWGKFSAQSRSPSISKSGTVYYPYFLASLVGVLENDGHQVDFIDECASSTMWDWGKRYDLIVVNTTTPSIHKNMNTVHQLREMNKDAIIVLVGPIVTFEPDEVFGMSFEFDAIARGEYEETITEMANDKPFNEIKGLSWRFTNKVDVVHNPDREPIMDLDSLPFVSQIYKRHLHIKDYFFAASDYPMVQILSARGCIWGKCSFCMTPVMEGKFRRRSVKNFVDELEWISKFLPEVKEIGIEDGCFGNNARVYSICEEIIRRGLEIKWYCNVRVTLDYPTMVIMKRAGCHLVTVGFESANQQVLDNIHKGIHLRQMKEFMDNANEAGLLVHGCFMSGNPGDTKETLKANYELACKLNCDTMQFFPLMPYPGTDAYRWAKDSGFIKLNSYEDYVTHQGEYNTVLDTPELSKQELVNISNESTTKYHTRPTYILRKGWRVITHPSEFGRTFKGFKSFVRRLILKA